MTANSYTRLGYTYQPPEGYVYDAPKTKTHLHGSYQMHFKTLEIETYKVIFI